MLAFRIALATSIAVLAAPAAALAAHGSHGPSATPLIVELMVVGVIAAGLLARRPLAQFARSLWSIPARRRRPAGRQREEPSAPAAW